MHETATDTLAAAAQGIAPHMSESHEIVPGSIASGVIVLCDHASNQIPPEYDDLGLPKGELARHIAWDIGAQGIARALAKRLEAPAIISRFSRLLIDPNRGQDDPTLVMRISDGAVIPGNAHVDKAEIARRKARFYEPYDDAISATIGRFRACGIHPALVSIHSFTPVWRGLKRPWHAAVLYDPRDAGFSRHVLDALARDSELIIGGNEPYKGGLSGDTMDRQGFARGLRHVLLEVRQDLIFHQKGQEDWARRIERAIRAALDATGGIGPGSRSTAT